jgi:NADPH-dependent 2,4-dienoyl-CoA reductase/sulfur reductase-like enzyme
MGVFPVRDLASARAAREWITGNPETIVLGGGLVGVKTAAQLARAGFPVTLVERETRLIPNLLTRETAAPLERHVAAIGVRLMLGATVEEIREDRSGALGSVRVSGRSIPCRTLLVAIGSLPALGFLRDTSLLEGDSLWVGPDLRTLNPRIYAAGDAVTIKGGFTPWTWPQAVIQGKLAGGNLYRTAPRTLRSLGRLNAQNVSGFALAALGAAPPGAEIAPFPGVDPETARELYFKDRRLVGGILAGKIAGAGTLGALMNRPECGKETIMERFLTPGPCFPEAIWGATRKLSPRKEGTG